METSYQTIINSFVDAYGLSRGQVIAEIERTFSSMLSRWHRKNVVVIFAEGQLLALGYHDGPDGPVQASVDMTTLRGWNTIKRILDRNLRIAASLDAVAKYKRKEKHVFWGDIVFRTSEELGVEIELEFGVSMLASCPLNYLGRHERDRLHPYARRAFHLRRVESVMVGDTPRIQITVDRVSKTLPEKLLLLQLESHCHGIRISCRKRYVGHKSFLTSNCFVPKNVILATARELGEHVELRVVRTTQQYSK